MNFKKKTRSISGSTLVLMLVIMIVMLILGTSMLTVGFDSQLISIKSAQAITARSAAEAGAAEGLKKVNDLVDASGWNTAWLPYSTTVPIALEGTTATYTYTIGDASTNHVIAATGTANGISKTVYITLKPTTMWFGIGVKDTVDIGSSVIFGSVPEPDGQGLRIQTNSTDDCAITIFPGTDIPGELVVGPGGSVDAGICEKPRTSVENTFVALEEIPFDPVPIPGIFDSMVAVDYIYDPNAPPLGQDGTKYYKFNDMIIPQGAIQIIDRPTAIPSDTDGDPVMIYVVGNTRIHQDAELRLTVGTALKFYANGYFWSDQSSLITNPNIDPAYPLYPDPRMLRIYGTDNCTSVILKNSGGFSGAVYAPNADVEIKNEGDFIGGVMGMSLDVKNSGAFYFDTRLATGDIWEEFAGFVVDRWWEE